MASVIDILLKAKDQASKEINRVSESLEDLDDSANETINASESLSDGFGNMSASFSTFTVAAVGVGLALKQAFDLGREGAQLLRIETSFEQMASSVGQNSDYMLAALQRASQGTIDNTALMLTANRTMMLGVTDDADKMANLLEIAAFRGRALGLSTEQAFNDIATGIGRNSPLILDNLGIVIDSEQAYKDYAVQIGKTADELTDAEKKQAILNDVLEDGNKQLDEAGGLAVDAAVGFDRLETSLKNAGDEIKQGLSPAMGKTASLISVAIDALVEYQSRTWGMTQADRDAVAEKARLEYGSANLATQLLVLRDEQDKVTDSTDGWLEAMQRAGDTTETTTEAIEGQIVVTGEYLKSLSDIGRELDSYKDKEQDLIDKRDEALESLNTLREQGWWEESQAVQDAKDKLDEYNEKLQENAESYEDSVNRRIIARATEILAMDGLTQEEEQQLLDMGLALGVYEQEWVDAQKHVMEQAQEIADVINGLPTQKTFTYFMKTAGSLSSNVALHARGERALGGNVAARAPYLVGERGPEMFVPSGSGRIIPNNELGGGGANVTLVYSPAVSLGSQQEAQDILLPFIRQGMREIQGT